VFQVIKKEKVLLHDIFNFIFVEPRERIRAGAGVSDFKKISRSITKLDEWKKANNNNETK
jgi:hypothetical protein